MSYFIKKCHCKRHTGNGLVAYIVIHYKLIICMMQTLPSPYKSVM